MKPLREILGENIAKAIENSGFTVREIAERLEISETSIHRWKSGSNPPDVNNLEALAKLLMIDPADLYSAENGVIPIHGEAPLRSYLVIPDDIVMELAHMPPDADVWDNIRGAIDEEKEHQVKLRAASKKA